MNDQEVRNRVVRKMLRKRVTGSKKQQLDTVINYSLPSHEQGRGRRLVEEMLADPDAPIQGYGGTSRQNVQLTGVEEAVEYLKDNNGQLPFGFD